MKPIFFAKIRIIAYVFIVLFTAAEAFAAHGKKGAPPEISIFWIIPFVCILLCIAVIPLINAHFWEKNLWWISVFVFCVPMALVFTIFMGEELREMTFEKSLEYVSFILLLASLFTISGGILIKGTLKGSPALNCVFLLIGSLSASVVGTTGASMLLIRPLIRANIQRKNKAHVIIFFIFIVSNIGGLLTPLGDPPLFLGYLQGVPFLWTMRLFPQWALAIAIVLTIFYFVDRYYFSKETKTEGLGKPKLEPATAVETKTSGKSTLGELKKDINWVIDSLDPGRLRHEGKISLKMIMDVRNHVAGVARKIERLLSGKTPEGPSYSEEKFGIDGKINFVFLAGIVALIFLQGLMVKEVQGWPHFGPQEGGMVLFTILSLLFTPLKSETRKQNGFSFGPIKEVAYLFSGIFATMIPALYILQHKGSALGITKPWQFFWGSGILSSFLDNAPTYLTFVSLGKGLGLPNDLGFAFNDGTGFTAAILAAVSCGSVFMGANTYIGNGPNFMVRSIAQEQGINMPSFFGYMAYSGAVLIPTFILLTFIFFV